MGQYDGREFEKILQEAQANMMKGIPSLEVEDNPALLPAANIVQEDIHSPVESGKNHICNLNSYTFFCYSNTLLLFFLYSI